MGYREVVLRTRPGATSRSLWLPGDDHSGGDPGDFGDELITQSTDALWQANPTAAVTGAPVAPWTLSSSGMTVTQNATTPSNVKANARNIWTFGLIFTTSVGGATLTFNHPTGFNTQKSKWLTFQGMSDAASQSMEVYCADAAGVRIGNAVAWTPSNANSATPFIDRKMRFNKILVGPGGFNLPYGTIIRQVVFKDTTGAARPSVTAIPDIRFARYRPDHHPGVAVQPARSLRDDRNDPANHCPPIQIEDYDTYFGIGHETKYKPYWNACKTLLESTDVPAGNTETLIRFVNRFWGLDDIPGPLHGQAMPGGGTYSQPALNLPFLTHVVCEGESNWISTDGIGDWQGPIAGFQWDDAREALTHFWFQSHGITQCKMGYWGMVGIPLLSTAAALLLWGSAFRVAFDGNNSGQSGWPATSNPQGCVGCSAYFWFSGGAGSSGVIGHDQAYSESKFGPASGHFTVPSGGYYTDPTPPWEDYT